MLEQPTITSYFGDLGYLYDRNGRGHPILKHTNTFVFTDDPVSRGIAQRLDYGDAGLRLKPFRKQRLQRWGFDSMADRVPYDPETAETVSRLNFAFAASLSYDDMPRYTQPPRAARSRAEAIVRRARTALEISPADTLTRAGVLVAFKHLVKQHHPDHGGDPEAFRKIVEARNELLAHISATADTTEHEPLFR